MRKWLPPIRKVVVLEKLPPDVVWYLQRKSINSDGARRLLVKYDEKVPEEISKRTPKERLAQLPMAVEPCPDCLSLDTRKLGEIVSVHGLPGWLCNACGKRFGVKLATV